MFKKYSNAALTVGSLLAASILLRGFIVGSRAGDPEYYLLLGGVGLAGLAMFFLVRLVSS